MESLLVRKCIEAATDSAAVVEKWRRQRRSLERMPSHLAEALLRRLLSRRLLFPSLLEVFKYSVEEIDLRSENCVDAEWMAYLGAFRYLRSMILADCHRINNSALWNITGMKCLQELDLSRCSKITDAGIKHLLSVPSLVKLYISATGVTADGVRTLAALTKLLVLDLGGLPVTDSALSSLQDLKKLQHLDLWGSEVSNSGALILEMFPSLSILNIGWTNVTDLPNLPSLKYLDMSNCIIHSLFEGEGQKPCMEKFILAGASVTDDSKVFQSVDTSILSFLDLSDSSLPSFNFLHSMKALTHLNLSGATVVDSSVESIACIGANLRYLNLNNTKVSSNGIAVLTGNVPNLETLLLSATSIDDTAIAYISTFPSLKILNLSSTNVKGLLHQEDDLPDEVLSFCALRNLIHLERLELEDIRINDAAFYPLTMLSRLSYLSVKSVSLTDSSLYHFSSAPKLIHLGIRDALLTDSALDGFMPPATLKVLDLNGCWLLTQDVLMHFCYRHPQIEVKHELVETFERREIQHSSPLQGTTRNARNKQKQSKLSVSPIQSNEICLDQRLKYSREELLALQLPLSMLTHQGILGP